MKDVRESELTVLTTLHEFFLGSVGIVGEVAAAVGMTSSRAAPKMESSPIERRCALYCTRAHTPISSSIGLH